MKKLPEPIKPDVATYNIAKRMETAGLLRKGQALMLAATTPFRPTVTRFPARLIDPSTRPSM